MKPQVLKCPNKAKWFAGLLLWALTLTSCATPQGIGDSLGLDPRLDWKTLETPHFRVTFPAELNDVATRSAEYLEEANTTLSKTLLWTPKNRTQVLIIDNTDAANGLTTPVGRFGMVFYVTPPDNWFSTAYNDDWLRLLAFHEYTHYLNMDVTRSYSDILRRIFGDVTLPNSLWPSWMLEGLAVYMETRYTHSGRGRSPLYEMILRSAVEANVLDTHSFMTLDRVSGTNPYYPTGETPYLFGYELMNQVSRGQESALGEMSYQSGGRIPFFINGNLENIIGKDWYSIWNDWSADIRTRTGKQLEKIRAQGVTALTPLTTGGRQTLGSAVSPDGHWLAYTQETHDQRFSIWLKDLTPSAGPQAKALPVTEKILGATLAFTPDSQAIIYSSLHRKGGYNFFSDLAVYNLQTRQSEWLTDHLRARDPDLSNDGKSVVFTLTQKATTGIATAPLEFQNGHYRLGPVKIVHMPEQFDSVYTPKFSRDGKWIYFSLHRNGKSREDLLALNLEKSEIREIVANGAFNRFPTVHPNGDLYFISDDTGVDNLYRYRGKTAPEAVTNVTTGLAFPTFGPTGRSFVNVFSFTGWDLAEVTPIAENGLTATIPTRIDPRPAPLSDSQSDPQPEKLDTKTADYSAFPSIWPRQWSPLFILNPAGVWVGGEILGFDALDRHRYLAALAYDTQTQRMDSVFYYANRTLGPTLTFSVDDRTANTYFTSSGAVDAYISKTKFHLDISQPFRWTYSAFQPLLAINTERDRLYLLQNNTFSPIASSRYIPSVDGLLSFSNTESSPLAISAEQGRSTVFGLRQYIGLDQTVLKGLIKDTEFLRLTEHTVLIPSAKFSWASTVSDYAPASVVVQGSQNSSLGPSLPSDNLDQLGLRGYPNQTYYAQTAGVFSLDYRFPLMRVYRGWGTHPFFLDEIYGYTFADFGFFPNGEPGASLLPSVGAGVHLNAELLLHLPLSVAVQVDRGLNTDSGGMGEFSIQLGVNGLSF